MENPIESEILTNYQRNNAVRRRESVILTSYANKGKPVKQSCASVSRPVYIDERAKVSQSSKTCRRRAVHAIKHRAICIARAITSTHLALRRTGPWRDNETPFDTSCFRLTPLYILIKDRTFACKKKQLRIPINPSKARDIFDRDQTLKTNRVR